MNDHVQGAIINVIALVSFLVPIGIIAGCVAMLILFPVQTIVVALFLLFLLFGFTVFAGRDD